MGHPVQEGKIRGTGKWSISLSPSKTLLCVVDVLLYYLRVGLVSLSRDAGVSLVDLGEVGVDGDGEQRVPVPAHQAQLDLVAHVDLVTCESDDALEVGLGDLRVADGALARGVVGEGQVVQDAGPAEDVAAPRIK